MREATRRQVFGIGAGAIGVIATGGAMAAVGDNRPNDARLMELARRYEDLCDHLDASESDEARDAYGQRMSAVEERAHEIEPDSRQGYAAKARMAMRTATPREVQTVVERLEHDALAALAQEAA